MSGRSRNGALWAGFLTGPVVFLAYLLVAYTLVQQACLGRGKGLLHASAAMALVLIASAGAVSFLELSRIGTGGTDEGEPEETRARFLAVAGIAMSLLFILVTIGGWIPSFIVGACD